MPALTDARKSKMLTLKQIAADWGCTVITASRAFQNAGISGVRDGEHRTATQYFTAAEVAKAQKARRPRGRRKAEEPKAAKTTTKKGKKATTKKSAAKPKAKKASKPKAAPKAKKTSTKKKSRARREPETATVANDTPAES